MPRRKRALRLTIGLFFAALLALTFLSNTIQGLSLPKVSVDKPKAGGLSLAVSGEGFLQPAHTAQLYAQGDWEVEKIYVSAHDRVKKGDPLVKFDTSSTERTLQDERTRSAQQKLQLEKLSDQLKMLLRGDDSSAIVNLQRDLESQRLDMQVQQRKIADLERQIAAGGTLLAPVDGVVTTMNASEGVTAGRGQPVVEIADDRSGYRFSIVADGNDASALRIGDKVDIQIDETPRGSVDGTIADIEDATSDDKSGNGKKITFDTKGASLKPGLKSSVRISSQSGAFGMQIPKTALKQDNGGYYLFTVKEKEGPLGTAYYASKTYVKISDESADTAVVEGLMPEDSYITESSEPIGDGDRVRY